MDIAGVVSNDAAEFLLKPLSSVFLPGVQTD